MRRLRILLAGLVATGALGAWSGVASADLPAGGDFCDRFTEFADDVEGIGVEDIDFTDPDATQELFEQAADAYKELADEAPRKVKKAFKTVANYYGNLADDGIDLSDPQAFEDLVPSGKVAKAFAKVGNHLADECGVDFTGEDVTG